MVDFLAAAAPTNRKCLHPHCKDGAGLHLRSLVHGNSLVTLSSFRLAPGKELEGNGSNGNGTVWLWLRPLGVASGTTPAPPSRRIALSPEASNMSFAHLLALMLDGRDLQAGGVDLQHSFVRYLGCGNAVICLHHTRVVPYTVCLPPPVVSIAAEEQARWLQEELRALVEVRLGCQWV